MTLDELGVTEAEWAACLDLIGEWKPGQRCPRSCERREDGWHHHCACYQISFISTKNEFRELEMKGLGMKEHDIPMPPVTDELLMQVLRKLGTRDQADLEIYKVDEVMWGIEVGTFVENAESLEAAIIHAGAALRKDYCAT